MALVIEATDESGPCGLPALSVAHYGEQNGDLMRDPEMCFELGLAEERTLPRSTSATTMLGIEQWSRTIEGDNYVFDRELYEQHEQFAKLWDKNLREQGFVEAFERQQAHTRLTAFPSMERTRKARPLHITQRSTTARKEQSP